MESKPQPCVGSIIIMDVNDFYYTALEICPSCIFILDTNGEIIFANHKAELLLGLSKDDIASRTYNDVHWDITDLNGNPFPDENLPYAYVMRTGKPIENVQHGLRGNKGEITFLSINASPIFNENQEITHVVATAEDISDLIKAKTNLQDSKNTYKNLFENLLDEVHLWEIISDEHGKIATWRLIDANPSALTSWKKSKEEVVGKTTDEIFGYGARDQFLPVVQRIFETGEPYSWEQFFPPTNQWLSMSSIPFKNSFISTGKDISEKKLAELELLDAKEKAELANRLKTEFLNNMSHEVRTPMNGIVGFADLLNEPNLSDENRKAYAKIIQNSGQQLLRIIDDILEISTLEIQKEEPIISEFSLNELLNELYSIFSLKSVDRKLPIYIRNGLPDHESYIFSDLTKLHKIVSNLIENALKFTEEGSIEVGYFIENSDLVLFVKDTGIGVNPQNHASIFDRFVQEDKEISKKKGGLGLGLSISKKNALILGGDITLESEKGKGSTFFVRIPYNKGKGKEQAQVKSENSSQDQSFTILIAEDEMINFIYFEVLFNMSFTESFNIIHAQNGREAVDICEANPTIDLVLMDIKMPVMGGYEATKIIKNKFPKLPVIAQTAYSTESDRKDAMNAGCDDFLTKPVAKELLVALVNRYLKIS